MITTLKFYGHSDDVFTVEGGATTDESYGGRDGIHIFEVVSANESLGLYVCGVYSPAAVSNACWFVGIAPLFEDAPLPSWNMRFEAKGYTSVLIIDAPDDVVISAVLSSGDEGSYAND